MLKRLSGRVADSADSVAAGTAVPAGVEPGEVVRAGAHERGAVRRRLRRLRRLRDALLMELGAVMLELRRQGREAPALVSRKLDELAGIDAEERALTAALGEPAGGAAEPWSEPSACMRCAAPLPAGARFCPSCATPVPSPRGVEAEAPAAGDDGRSPHVGAQA